jgi:hypothetical protein
LNWLSITYLILMIICRQTLLENLLQKINILNPNLVGNSVLLVDLNELKTGDTLRFH